MLLALSVGLLAGLLTYFTIATSDSLHIIIWVSFISWAVYFVAGADKEAIWKSFVPLSAGIIWGFACIMVTQVTLHSFSIPVMSLTVGLAAMVMVLMAKIPLFALTPAQFIGFASYFGAFFGNAAGKGLAPWLVAVYVIVSLGVGVLAGFISVQIPALIQGKTIDKQSSPKSVDHD